MNDIVGVNTRAFELAAAGSCQVADFKEDLATLFKPGEEVLVYRDLGELKRTLDFYLARPDEARAIGDNARRRALKEHTVRHRLEEIIAVTEARASAGAPEGAASRPRRSPRRSAASTARRKWRWAIDCRARAASACSS